MLALGTTLSLAATACAVETAFSDVDADHPFAGAIRWAAENGYVNGYSDGRFGVDDYVTRAQLAAVFHRSAGSPTASGAVRFSDVAATVDLSNISSYDQGCVEEFQNTFGDYFNGKISLDKAKANFEMSITERYPWLVGGGVEWP